MTAGCDLVSISAHKIGGPKGVGALIVRGSTRLVPLLWGGGQEHERRSGTHNVAGHRRPRRGVARRRRRAAALETVRVAALRDHLADSLCAGCHGTVESAPRDDSLPGHCHLRFDGVDQEELLVLLDGAGVCASAGSACASGAVEPSHVLLAMGVHAGARPAPGCDSASGTPRRGSRSTGRWTSWRHAVDALRA